MWPLDLGNWNWCLAADERIFSMEACSCSSVFEIVVDQGQENENVGSDEKVDSEARVAGFLSVLWT